DLPCGDAGERQCRMGGALDLEPSRSRPAARGSGRDHTRRWRRPRRGRGARLRLALEARRPASAHRPPAARDGLQRSAAASHASRRGGRAMSILDAASNDAVCAAIAAAEEVRDPLDGLIERTTADPGAVFAPEVLERLVGLKRDDRAAFEALRAQLKKAGCRMMALDEAIAEENGDTGGRGPTQADILINVAKE